MSQFYDFLMSDVGYPVSCDATRHRETDNEMLFFQFPKFMLTADNTFARGTTKEQKLLFEIPESVVH